MRDKFEGQFLALVKMGKQLQNPHRFKPLTGSGKPLWEFKEHDHRIYCDRQEYPNGSVQGVLLCGWVKDKEGRTTEENNQIVTAMALYRERQAEEFSK